MIVEWRGKLKDQILKRDRLFFPWYISQHSFHRCVVLTSNAARVLNRMHLHVLKTLKSNGAPWNGGRRKAGWKRIDVAKKWKDEKGLEWTKRRLRGIHSDSRSRSQNILLHGGFIRSRLNRWLRPTGKLDVIKNVVILLPGYLSNMLPFFAGSSWRRGNNLFQPRDPTYLHHSTWVNFQ